MDSGLENADRSTSSDHGRRVERPDWTVSVMLLTKARKAGVATGAWDSPANMESDNASEAINCDFDDAARLIPKDLELGFTRSGLKDEAKRSSGSGAGDGRWIENGEGGKQRAGARRGRFDGLPEVCEEGWELLWLPSVCSEMETRGAG